MLNLFLKSFVHRSKYEANKINIKHFYGYDSCGFSVHDNVKKVKACLKFTSFTF